MSLSARHTNVFARLDLFDDSLIQVMPGLQAICGVMPRYAGVVRLLRRLMALKMSEQHVRHCMT